MNRHTPARLATPFLTNPARPTLDKPWKIRYVLADLDGTRMSSYSAFHALELLAVWLCGKAGRTEQTVLDVTRELASIVRTQIGIEALLHEPEPTLQRLATSYVQSNNGLLQTQVSQPDFLQHVPGVIEACANSFRLFPGAEGFLQQARLARTAFGIFTATAPEHAVNRMIRAGENPDLIQEIWCRSRCESQLAGHFDWRSATTEQRAFLTKLRPYRDSKPHPGPLHAVHKEYEITPESVLMIGEGCADLGCVLEHPGRLTPDSQLYARFAFQRQGAAETEAFADINAILREGHPLGIRCFDNLYPDANRHPGIITLVHGFQTLIEMVNSGLIVLKPTPPPLHESPLTVSGYYRPATKAPNRRRVSHPIDTSE